MKVGNFEVDQIRSDLSSCVDVDQMLTKAEMLDCLSHFLPDGTVTAAPGNSRIFFYVPHKPTEESITFLAATISYMGGAKNGRLSHPSYLKKIELKPAWKEYVLAHPNEDVRFLGVYYFDGNVVFADFVKDTYLEKKMNNSAAHILANDIYMAMKNGTFHKVDKNGNSINVIRSSEFQRYVSSEVDQSTGINLIFELFERFNNDLPFGVWITGLQAMITLYNKEKLYEEKGVRKITNWRQLEWAGWLLESWFDDFCEKNDIDDVMKYMRNKDEKTRILDFDIYFEEMDFWGDLKASTTKETCCIGNDQRNVMNAIMGHDRFWYIVYSHDSEKDDENDSMTRKRNAFRNEQGDNKEPLSGKAHTRNKARVMFKKMAIYELNRYNYKEFLREYNQGVNSNGRSRNPKFMLDKTNDNLIIFEYTYNPETCRF